MTLFHVQTMRALFLKDWRFFRFPELALIAAGLGAYATAVISAAYPGSLLKLSDALMFTSIISMYLICLIAAAFGGLAIAGERKDRAGEFLAMLPISRRQIMLSKCLASLFIMGACVLLHLLILVGAAAIRSHEQPELFAPPDARIWVPVAMWFACTLCFFGVAWLFSTFLNSGPVSACVSIGITIALMLLAATTTFQSMFFGLRLDETGFAIWYAAVIAFFGFCAWIAGTIYYARRITP